MEPDETTALLAAQNLDKLPRREHKEAAIMLRTVYLAEKREEVKHLAGKLISKWKQIGYARAAECLECLERALDRLPAFYRFPLEHARQLRTTNVIESPFATVRLRANSARRFRSQHSALHLMFKILERAEKGWHTLAHADKLKEVKLPDKQIS